MRSMVGIRGVRGGQLGRGVVSPGALEGAMLLLPFVVFPLDLGVRVCYRIARLDLNHMDSIVFEGLPHVQH